VIPAHIVRKIQKGDYLDMAELLKDNMEAKRRRAIIMLEKENSNPQPASPGGRREVPGYASWLHCFAMYAAVAVKKLGRCGHIKPQ